MRKEKRREKTCSSNALESFDLQTRLRILANFAFNLFSFYYNSNGDDDGG